MMGMPVTRPSECRKKRDRIISKIRRRPGLVSSRLKVRMHLHDHYIIGEVPLYA